MATTRERFYACSFTSGGRTRTEYVRAWSATDAKRAFAEMLASDGEPLTGNIEAVLAGREPANDPLRPPLGRHA